MQRKPPLNGSFPLDHSGKCRDAVLQYLACLASNREEQTPCKQLLALYLQCRRDKHLLNNQDEAILGIK